MRYRQRGFHYVEVLVATVVLAAALAPALEALHAAAAGQAAAGGQDQRWAAVQARMEQVLAQPFAALDAAAAAAGGRTVPTAYSDPAGNAERVVVYLSRYDGDDADADGDPFTGTDDGLLWVAVQAEGGRPALFTLTAR